MKRVYDLWAKADYLLGILVLSFLFGLVVFVANTELKDLDIWLHIASGRYIANHNFIIPSRDFLSCSIAGAPWINHEWLFQLIVYYLFHFFGANGLLVMQMVLVFITISVLLLTGYSRERQLSNILLLVFVFLIYQQRFTVRPDLYSLLFFALYIFVLALHIDKKWSIYALFFVQILWTNMHGFFFFGPLFILIGIVSELIKRHIPLPYEWNESGRLNDDEFSRLIRIFIFVLLACLINPSFVKGALYPITVFSSFSGDNSIFFKYIIELKKPIAFNSFFDSSPYIFFKVFIFISFVSFFFNRRNIDISALFLWVIFLVFSLNAVRNIPFFAFASYLVCITNSYAISFKDVVPLRFTDKKFKYITYIAVKFAILMWIFMYYQAASSHGYYDFDKYKFKSGFGDVSLRNYPYKAADFLVDNNIKGNFFNDFNSGAYLLGRCHPNIKVFIDGRTEVYGGRFFKNYLDIWEKGDSNKFEEAGKRYNLTGAFLNSVNQEIPDGILTYLYKNDNWKIVYFDYDAVIFLKNVPENEDIIKKFKVDFSNYKPKELDLFKIGTTRVDPYRNLSRAYTLTSLGLYDQALKEVNVALKIEPTYIGLYGVLGKIYAKKKDFEKAFESFRIAVSYMPNDLKNRYNLALSCYDMKRYDYAIKGYKEIIDMWPKEATAYVSLALTYAKDKQSEMSLKTLRRIEKLEPKAFMDVILIADAIFNNGDYLLAKQAYNMALGLNNKASLIHQKLGLVYKALGEKEQAVKEFNESLLLDPENNDSKDALRDIEKK